MSEKNHSVLESINENYRQLFTAEKKVADYILANSQNAIMMNITELAQKSKTSEATVVRMCKHLGYQGYYQMRLIMSHDLGKRRASYEENEVLDTAKKLFDSSAGKIEELGRTIDIAELMKVADILRRSRMVHIAAAGNTTPVALDLGFRLERCKIPCSYSMIPEHFLNHISLGSSEDTIVAISRSGESKQVIQAMDLAKKNHMCAILITGHDESQLMQYADSILRVQSETKKLPAATEPSSHLCEIAINDAIIYVLRHYESLVTHSQNKEEAEEDCDEVELLLSEYKL